MSSQSEIKRNEQGPYRVEDPAVVAARWSRYKETFDDLAKEIKEQKIAEGLKALGPPPSTKN